MTTTTTVAIKGGRPLYGEVRLHSAKNAVLPCLAAVLLTEEPCSLENVPTLDDVTTMGLLLEELGVTIDRQGSTWHLQAKAPLASEAPFHLVRRMRASFLILGPLLARLGRVVAPLPGGCAIGERPVDLHLKGLQALGAEITVGHGYVEARARHGLVGQHIYLDYPSHTATENVVMAAALARGVTWLENAAEEPEVADLVNFLNRMGAQIAWQGSRLLRVKGVAQLHGGRHRPIPDRIEAGSYLAMVGAAGGRVRLQAVQPRHLTAVLAKLREAGFPVETGEDWVELTALATPSAISVKTLPFPGFPTDLQAPLTALLTRARGTSVITETVFENRFRHVPELRRMGAHIDISGRTAIIHGVAQLTGADVQATDLRAGAGLVVAGLAARGTTYIHDFYHVDRGYTELVEQLSTLGAEIHRVPTGIEAPARP